MKKQEDKSFYRWSNYVSMARWGAYWHQINEVNIIQPSSVLIIGPGDNIIKSVLQSRDSNICVKTLDIADDLNPDFLGSVSDITKITNETFDCILCNQVLEHLPWDMFDTCLHELYMASNESVVLSLPQKYWEFSIHLTMFSVKLINKFNAYSFVKWYKKFSFPTSYGHYWEIGAAKHTSKKIIKERLERYFEIERIYTIEEYPYHRFFILKKRFK